MGRQGEHLTGGSVVKEKAFHLASTFSALCEDGTH